MRDLDAVTVIAVADRVGGACDALPDAERTARAPDEARLARAELARDRDQVARPRAAVRARPRAPPSPPANCSAAPRVRSKHARLRDRRDRRPRPRAVRAVPGCVAGCGHARGGRFVVRGGELPRCSKATGIPRGCRPRVSGPSRRRSAGTSRRVQRGETAARRRCEPPHGRRAGTRRAALRPVGNSDSVASDPYIVEVGDLSDRALWQQARKATTQRSASCSNGTPAGSTTTASAAPATGRWPRTSTSTTFLVAWRSQGNAALQAESAAPLLYGIATNVLRNDRRSVKRRRQRSRSSHPATEEPDIAEESAPDSRPGCDARAPAVVHTTPAPRTGRRRALRLERALLRRRRCRPRYPDRHGSLATGTRPSSAAGTRNRHRTRSGRRCRPPLRIEVSEQ